MGWTEKALAYCREEYYQEQIAQGAGFGDKEYRDRLRSVIKYLKGRLERA
jgi:hypothetical protein